MIIRRVESKDRDSVFHLLNELRRSGYAEMGEAYTPIPITKKAESLFSELLTRHDVHILVAEEANEISGVCVAYEIPKVLDGNKRLLIEELVVLPEKRDQGVGSAFLEHLEKIALEQGIIIIKVSTGTKLKANQFYQKHGFVHFENSYRKKL